MWKCPRNNIPAEKVEFESGKNVMQCGTFHHVEVGRKQGNLWLEVDGNKLFQTKDQRPHGAGHVAIRIRGTAGEYAACFIRNLEIVTGKENDSSYKAGDSH